MAIAETQYRDDNIIADRGYVLVATAGTAAPTIQDIQTWIDGGATGKLGSYTTVGHTSAESLPSVESETEGGEYKASWQNPQLRTTPTVTTSTISVALLQWGEQQLKQRYGSGKFDKASGTFEAPIDYTHEPVALLVIYGDKVNKFLAMHYEKVQPSPGDSIEFSTEDFAEIGIVYKPLRADGSNKLFSIISPILQKGNTSTPRREDSNTADQ